MSDVAMLTLSGRVVRDGEVETTPNGTPVLKFSIACNRWKGNKQQTSFYDCVAWGKFGETKSRFTSRGQHLHIGGHVDIEEYEGQSGKVRKPVVTVHTLEPSPGGGDDYQNGYQPRQANIQPRPAPKVDFGGPTFDDDIPF